MNQTDPVMSFVHWAQTDAKAAQGLTRIFPLRTIDLKKNQFGFTLLEMLVVLAIVAGIVAVALPRIQNQNNQIKSVLRKITVLSKSVHNAARLSGRTYRIAFEMPEGVGKPHTYWVETATALGAVVEVAPEDEEKDDEKKAPSKFTPDPTIMKRPMELPGNFIFEEIEIAAGEKSYTTGKAYIHYLPQGFVDHSAIHISNRGDLHWTIRIHPLTGQGHIYSENKPLKEFVKE